MSRETPAHFLFLRGAAHNLVMLTKSWTVDTAPEVEPLDDEDTDFDRDFEATLIEPDGRVLHVSYSSTVADTIPKDDDWFFEDW